MNSTSFFIKYREVTCFAAYDLFFNKISFFIQAMY